MRLTKIRVEELFGTFDHEIPIQQAEHITIIHGPNGFGKTSILRLLAASLAGDLKTLRRVPFTTIVLSFDNGSKLTVTRGRDSGTRGRSAFAAPIDFHLEGASPGGRFHVPGIREELDPIIERLDVFIPFLSRVGPSTWLDTRRGARMDLDEVLEKFGPRLPLDRPIHSVKRPEWLEELGRQFPCRVIEAQRLDARNRDREGEEQTVRSVVMHSKRMAHFYETALRDYGLKAQSLDRTFPMRLLRWDIPSQSLGTEEIMTRLAQLDKRRDHLTRLGLLDEDPELFPRPRPEVVGDRRDALSIYIKDAEEKLQVFKTLADKAEAFVSIVNARFQFKKLSLHRDKGFVFKSDVGDPLLPEDLSSGEQHELILLFELLFNAPERSIVLIDEPEMSLHVSWQTFFLSDLQQIVRLSGIDAIVATHSPEIIGNHWNWTVELRSPSRG